MTRLDPATVATVHACVGVGMLVVVPVGIRLVGRPVPRPASAWWLGAAACGAASVWLPVGGWAAVVAVPWLVACALLALAGLGVLVRRDRPGWPGLAVGLATPLVGALALVAERAGWGLLGYSGDYLTLTVPHMLFAGFGACLIAGLGVEDGRAARWAGWTVPVGVLLVLVGYFVGDAAELVGALVLTAGLYGVALATLGALPPGRAPRRLLAVGAVTVLASMVLALWWALGEATGLPHPGIGLMAATHGVANALGFVLATLVGLRLLRPRATGLTYAEVGATRDADLPAGYRHLDARFPVRDGATTEDLAAYGEDLLSWTAHRRAGVRIDGEPVAEGGLVTSGIGVGPLRLSEPCEIVWVERSAARVGFAYGTLPGHLFAGEEAFVVELDDGTLWFRVRVFSRPAQGWVRVVGPVAGVAQRAYAGMLARSVRRAPAPSAVAR